MKRVFVVLVLIVGALLTGASRASAITELCPAYASHFNPLDAAAGSKAATTFSYELDALSPSTVSGTLAVETDKGWFSVPFGPIAMAVALETFEYTGTKFTRKNVFSNPLYVRFDAPVTVLRDFVVSANTDDTSFSWPSRPVPCDYAGGPVRFAEAVDPFAAIYAKMPAGFGSPPSMFATHAELAVPPGPQTPVAAATKRTDFDGLACAKPFVDPGMTSSPKLPYAMPSTALPTLALTAWVVVAIDARGSVLDSWLYAPSASPDFDKAALRAASRQTFTPAVSRCASVPSLFLFNEFSTGLSVNG